VKAHFAACIAYGGRGAAYILAARIVVRRFDPG
jgi:hypothetical protein